MAITSGEGLVGRESELAVLRDVFEHQEGVTAAVIQGEVGIGKTAIWEASLKQAAELGYRVLQARAAQTEVQLALSTLGDLFEDLHGELLRALPPPQQQALAVALLLEESETLPSERALAVAVLAALRALAARGPTVVAVDDVQWIDATTAAVLSFAARRVHNEQLLFLLATRTGPDEPTSPVVRAIDPVRVVEVALGPLSLGALGALLRARLDVPLPRPLLRTIHETSGGNPFFAVELTRALKRRGLDSARGADMSVPPTLKALVRERLAGLPPATREALLALAATAEPSPALLESALGLTVDLEPVIEAGIIERVGDEFRFTHPLLAASLLEDTQPANLRRLHLRLADVISEPEQRARHLAAASTAPDESVAAELDRAAIRARARGALPAAAELAELALDLTGAKDVSVRARRAGTAGWFYAEVGDGVRGSDLMRLGIDLLPPGHERAEAIRLLLASPTRIGDPVGLAMEALAQSGDDELLQARLHFDLAEIQLVRGVFDDALDHARQACELARRVGDETLFITSSARTANLETLLDIGDPELALHEAIRLEGKLEAKTTSVTSPRNHLARRLFWRDDLDGSRLLFEELRELAIATYTDAWLPNVCLHLARLELRGGRFEVALRYADEAFELAENAGYPQVLGAALCTRALVAGYRGELDESHRLMALSNELTAEVGDVWHTLHNRVTLGLVAVSAGRYEDAVAGVGTLGAELDDLGIREPGVFIFEGDAIEACVALARFAEAEALIERLESHPRARCRAVAARGRGLLLGVRGEIEAATAAFEESLCRHDEFADPFERGRTLVTQGTVLRRARRMREARAALESAHLLFEQLGARAFAARAQDELERLSGRRTAGGLTSTEARVAACVARGLTNKQVAGELVVTVRAVEAHLTRIYAKLGVRSRTELVRALTLANRD